MHIKLKIRVVALLVLSLITGIVMCSCSDIKKEGSIKEKGQIKDEVVVQPDVQPMFVTLMFHEISDKDVKGTTTISKRKLEEILKYLSENNYKFLSAQEAYDLLTKNVPIPEKSVWLTFDDGLKSAHKAATASLKKYNAKATAFIEVMQIGDPLRLTKKDLKAMSESGFWDIQSHGYNGHATPLVDEEGKKVNFYFNRFKIQGKKEAQEDFKARIKRDIEKSFDFLQNEFESERYFFAYPIDGATSENCEEINTIQVCLDEMNILGVGVNGSTNLSVDRSNLKHCYTRYGVKNSSNIKEILSIKNTGKRINIYDKDKAYSFTNITKYLNNQYIAWDNTGNFALLDNNMRPIGKIIRIKKKENEELSTLKGKTSVAVNSKGEIRVSNWDERKLFELDKNWIIKNEYDLAITPVSIWFNKDRLFIIDTAGSIYSFDKDIESIEFCPEYKIGCAGGCAEGNIVYVSDFVSKKIYKVDYINKALVGSKKYGNTHIITPHIADKPGEFIANEGRNNILVRIKY